MTYRLRTQDQRYQIAALHPAEISNKDIALVVTATRARSAGSCGATARTSSTDEAQQMSEMIRLLQIPGMGSESQLMEAALREKGIPLTPPADWQPHTPD